jgi:hypothetical protein
MKSPIVKISNILRAEGPSAITARVNRRIAQLIGEGRLRVKTMGMKHFTKYERGSKEWLESCEFYMGGYVKDVARAKVSPGDPRSKSELNCGGMVGGDRMLHHGYAKYYAKHLRRFVEPKNDLVVVECGILRGTGLGGVLRDRAETAACGSR